MIRHRSVQLEKQQNLAQLKGEGEKEHTTTKWNPYNDKSIGQTPEWKGI